MYTNFNCKAVEVPGIEEVNSKNSGRRNHRWRRDDELKKHDVPNNSRYRFAATN